MTTRWIVRRIDLEEPTDGLSFNHFLFVSKRRLTVYWLLDSFSSNICNFLQLFHHIFGIILRVAHECFNDLLNDITPCASSPTLGSHVIVLKITNRWIVIQRLVIGIKECDRRLVPWLLITRNRFIQAVYRSTTRI